MTLVIDVGNTNITCAVYDNDLITAHFRISTMVDRTKDEFGMLILSLLKQNNINEISCAVIASVVPQVMYSLERAITQYIGVKPYVVQNDMDLGIKIMVDNPVDLGVDRLVNAFAACNKYSPPLIVVDFGTATTFCAINRDLEYLGGAIAPGIKLSAKSLYQGTAKLPRIELSCPENPIGTNTVAAMQSGVILGYVGATDYIVRSISRQMNQGDCTVIASGGLAGMIALSSECISVVEPYLTLDGLYAISTLQICNRNKNQENL